MLAKYFGLYEDKVSHSDAITIKWQTDDEPSGAEVNVNPSPNAEKILDRHAGLRAG